MGECRIRSERAAWDVARPEDLDQNFHQADRALVQSNWFPDSQAVMSARAEHDVAVLRQERRQRAEGEVERGDSF